ncbi:MAG TPA: pyridoxal-phosphate dependent enzyme [Acidimicrobiales bacterium]
MATLTCPRCGRPGTGFAGCPRCRAEGVAVNLVPPLADLRGRDLAAYPGGPWGWSATLARPGGPRPTESLPTGPLPTESLPTGPSLGEGNTPLVPVEAASGGELWVKDESRNPTGSHKDRAMAAGVAAAVAAGADTVVAATSGNAGAAAAAYAARAGLRCVVLTTTAVPGALAGQIQALGATLAGYPDGATRNAVMETAVEELGWYPLTNYVRPVAGANPYAIEGYKSIAYELARDLDPPPDAVVVPTSAADLLAGVERGYRELAEAGLVAAVPRLVAAETATGAAFTAALRHPDRPAQERTRVAHHPSPAFSIGNAAPAWQGLDALWRTGGTAVAVEVEDYMDEHRRLPRTAGLFLEAASAVAVRAARDLVRDGVPRVVALGTGSGLKGLGDPPALPAPAAVWELAELADRTTADAPAQTADPAGSADTG